MFDNILIDLFILGMFGIAVYSLLILPRQRQFRKQQQYVAELAVGSRVTTYGGIIGTVKEIQSERGVVLLEIADGLVVEILTPAIMGEFDEQGVADSAQRALGKKDKGE